MKRTFVVTALAVFGLFAFAPSALASDDYGLGYDPADYGQTVIGVTYDGAVLLRTPGGQLIIDTNVPGYDGPTDSSTSPTPDDSDAAGLPVGYLYDGQVIGYDAPGSTALYGPDSSQIQVDLINADAVSLLQNATFNIAGSDYTVADAEDYGPATPNGPEIVSVQLTDGANIYNIVGESTGSGVFFEHESFQPFSSATADLPVSSLAVTKFLFLPGAFTTSTLDDMSTASHLDILGIFNIDL